MSSSEDPDGTHRNLECEIEPESDAYRDSTPSISLWPCIAVIRDSMKRNFLDTSLTLPKFVAMLRTGIILQNSDRFLAQFTSCVRGNRLVNTRGAFHFAKNFGQNSNGKARFASFAPEYSGPLLEVDHFDRLDRSDRNLPFHFP